MEGTGHGLSTGLSEQRIENIELTQTREVVQIQHWNETRKLLTTDYQDRQRRPVLLTPQHPRGNVTHLLRALHAKQWHIHGSQPARGIQGRGAGTGRLRLCVGDDGFACDDDSHRHVFRRAVHGTLCPLHDTGRQRDSDAHRAAHPARSGRVCHQQRPQDGGDRPLSAGTLLQCSSPRVALYAPSQHCRKEKPTVHLLPQQRSGCVPVCTQQIQVFQPLLSERCTQRYRQGGRCHLLPDGHMDTTATQRRRRRTLYLWRHAQPPVVH